MTELLPRARRWSRVLALGAVAGSQLPVGRSTGSVGVQQAVVLGALALGMPHGAADTELLRSAAAGSGRRHVALAVAYAALGTASTVVVRRGGGTVERMVLLASAAHFGEGELACWRPAKQASPAGTVLRLASAALTTVALPAAVGTANRRPPEVGVTGALATPPRGMGDRTGVALLRDPGTRRVVVPLTALAGATTVALALAGDREAAADSALLGGLALLVPPATAFAVYFGGWHALRHTARVVDALVAEGQLPVQRSLPSAFSALGRRSAWAAAVGLVAAGGLAAADPDQASDNAFAAVLGLTVPHMTTVGLQLTRRGR